VNSTLSTYQRELLITNNNRKPLSRTASPGTIVAFSTFLFIHILAALYSPIQDCDEVYNYWEPTHYINHGYGRQTWEYSPEYSIRSWAYAGLHALVIKLGSVLPFVGHGNKVVEFYFLRLVLGFICAVCETRLYTQIRRLVNGRIATLFLIIMATSPGMLHASVAYLPSSFAMYTFMLSLSEFMDWRGGIRTAQGIMWMTLGGALGWPFALALVLPFLVEEGLIMLTSGDVVEPVLRVVDGTVRGVLIIVGL
jgi:alpha-1,2-mannosyltransferase